jgi:hypothetical protein
MIILFVQSSSEKPKFGLEKVHQMFNNDIRINSSPVSENEVVSIVQHSLVWIVKRKEKKLKLHLHWGSLQDCTWQNACDDSQRGYCLVAWDIMTNRSDQYSLWSYCPSSQSKYTYGTVGNALNYAHVNDLLVTVVKLFLLLLVLWQNKLFGYFW